MAWSRAEDDKSLCMLPEFYLQIIEVTKGFLRDEDQKPDLYIEGETPMVENAWS